MRIAKFRVIDKETGDIVDITVTEKGIRISPVPGKPFVSPEFIYKIIEMFYGLIKEES